MNTEEKNKEAARAEMRAKDWNATAKASLGAPPAAGGGGPEAAPENNPAAPQVVQPAPQPAPGGADTPVSDGVNSNGEYDGIWKLRLNASANPARWRLKQSQLDFASDGKHFRPCDTSAALAILRINDGILTRASGEDPVSGGKPLPVCPKHNQCFTTDANGFWFCPHCETERGFIQKGGGSGLLEEIRKDRAAKYGDMHHCNRTVGKAWTAVLEQHYGIMLPHTLPGFMVALMMATVKINRAAFSNLKDSYVDGQHYIQIAGEVDDRERKD